ncbi:MAG: homoserine kinase [Balneolaceae bacterium]|nr:MAG: homoserine kinase [Balneolaceae bacterium]
MPSTKSVRVFAPATVANVACGFDVLGFAIHGLGDYVTARFVDQGGLGIESITGDGGRLPKETSKNTAGLAALALLKKAGKESGANIQLSIEKNMPLGSGLGSSAASSAAAVVAVNELIGKPFSVQELLPFAVEGEMAASGSAHADNVAAALFGGFILVKTHNPPDVISLPTPSKLHCTIIHPSIEIQTRNSRMILKKDVLLEKAVTQWANLGALVAGLYTEDYELISRSLHDEIIEPVRSILIPGFADMKQAAIDAGALGCSISGSGPSIFALSISKKEAESIGNSMGSVLKKIGLEYHTHVSEINTTGAHVVKA